jgi:hypothetical protein
VPRICSRGGEGRVEGGGADMQHARVRHTARLATHTTSISAHCAPRFGSPKPGVLAPLLCELHRLASCLASGTCLASGSAEGKMPKNKMAAARSLCVCVCLLLHEVPVPRGLQSSLPPLSRFSVQAAAPALLRTRSCAVVFSARFDKRTVIFRSSAKSELVATAAPPDCLLPEN